MAAPPIKWADEVVPASCEGRLMALLEALPRARWGEQEPDGWSFLHYAGRGDNVAAVVALLKHGRDANARTNGGRVAAHVAAFNGQARLLEVLCAAGADMRVQTRHGGAPLDFSFQNAVQDACVRVLVANGVRLNTVHERYRDRITPELEAFERGVLRCRAAVVAMLRVKRAGKLWMWDKFLLAEMALCIWPTRYDKGWQTN